MAALDDRAVAVGSEGDRMNGDDQRPIDELAARRTGRFPQGEQLILVARSEGESDPEASSYGPLVIDALRDGTTPIPGRDGWRIDASGIEWFSSAWLGLHE